MRKLIIIPNCGAIGGVTVSLSQIIQGFQQLGLSEQLCVLVIAGSEMEKYLQQARQSACITSLSVQSREEFCRRALRWATKQPRNWPLLLENWTASATLSAIFMITPILRLSGRTVYHTFHDPACSTHWYGTIARKFIYTCLSPVAICNSQFTARNVCPRLLSEVKNILYQPVAIDKQQRRFLGEPPEPLKPILRDGASIMLTPSRISQPEQFNDKNLRGLIPVLAELKASGHHYHSVVIGRDYSANGIQTQRLLEQASHFGVADRFTVLPPTFSIQDYYNYADVVVTLAPREPFGRTVIEAIASGVPVIGSQTGGIGEILNHFAPQWTVAPDDPVATAAAIVQLKNDPITSTLLAQGQRWVEEQCNPVQYARRLIEITELNGIKYDPNQSESKEIVSV
ncbi:group 1 glycosyl transferase [Aphanothece hegewaldii CCALA 016]|uniref:Group 1 glycosyl transferase n=1 Tax=Aphanothece hegewaldii CCALA 016 TaxID=2107694 RepID=A0A2T1M1T3_9CHRO|nr:glycosyltransferase family 4 protein [Aphanothece hegewaldii]PSF38676.1 group 1 glycosyl transferase [Aphanothece hegewaldii CCALA 016]